MSPQVLHIAERLYRASLRLYPADHRQQYGALMAQTFHDQALAVYAREGRLALVHLWAATLLDTTVSATIEHSSVMRGSRLVSRKTLMVLGLTLVLSILTGYVDLTATENMAPMLCILLFSFLAGFIQPKGAWRWALLIGLSVPVATFVGLAINFNFADTPPRFPITLAVLVIPALVAAYGGVFFHSAITRMQPPASTPA